MRHRFTCACLTFVVTDGAGSINCLWTMAANRQLDGRQCGGACAHPDCVRGRSALEPGRGQK